MSIVAAPCARLQFVREPVRNGGSVRPLNLIVRHHHRKVETVMRVVERIEALVVYALVVMLLLSVILGTIQLGRVLLDTVFQPPFLLIEPATLFQSFGLFLIILIGLELLKLLKLHLLHHKLRPELVIEVAIIAVCNKVVTLDLKTLAPETTIGLAALLLALSAGYYVFTKARREGDEA